MLQDLKAAEAQGLVRSQSHPTEDLLIWNYTPECAYSRSWNPTTLAARGLVTNPEGEVVARPWGKFFNYAEMPLEKWVYGTHPVCYEKMDGSLGIQVTTKGGIEVATRGSFSSIQALHATEVLRTRYPDFSPPEGVTTLWEIVYPENLVVVPYGMDDLILLGAVENATGLDVPEWEIDWWRGPRAENYGQRGDVDDIYRFATGNDFEEKEGIVAVWHRPDAPSFRLKFKHPRYLQLHRIMTGFSPVRVWEALAGGEDVEALIANTPDEFYTMYDEMVQDMKAEYLEIEENARAKFEDVKDMATRKAMALEMQRYPLRNLVFAMLDEKDYSGMIWKMLRPRGGE